MKMKKLFSVIFTILMLFSVNILSAFAQPTNVESKDSIDAALIGRGYPAVVLEKMSPSVKQSIYEDTSLYFKGASILTYDQENGSVKNYEIPADGSITFGQIPDADLDLVWSVNGVHNSTNVNVKYSYSWNKLPVFRWQDPIAVSWDDSIFEMKSDSFHKVDNFDGHLLNPDTGAITSTVTGGVHSEAHNYANGFSSGVTWYADLKGYTNVDVTRLYGYGELVLENKTSSKGSSKIYGHYVHPKISANLGINIGGYGSFSVSGGGNYDEIGNHTDFTY